MTVVLGLLVGYFYSVIFGVAFRTENKHLYRCNFFQVYTFYFHKSFFSHNFTYLPISTQSHKNFLREHYASLTYFDFFFFQRKETLFFVTLDYFPLITWIMF